LAVLTLVPPFLVLADAAAALADFTSAIHTLVLVLLISCVAMQCCVFFRASILGSLPVGMLSATARVFVGKPRPYVRVCWSAIAESCSMPLIGFVNVFVKRLSISVTSSV